LSNLSAADRKAGGFRKIPQNALSRIHLKNTSTGFGSKAGIFFDQQ